MKIHVLSGIVVLMLMLLVGCRSGVKVETAGVRWHTDFEKAVEETKGSGKHMLLNFTGSDWCGVCVKLDEEVFSTKEFLEYAQTNLVCLLLDFPDNKEQSDKLKKQNFALANNFEVMGPPTIIVISSDGTKAAKTGYLPGGATIYIEHLKELIDSM